MAQDLALMPSGGEWQQMMQMADILVRSGVLPNAVKSKETAVAIMLKSRELNIPPMRGFAQISVINGKPALGAELMLARIYEVYPRADIVTVRREADGALIRARRSAKHEYTDFEFNLEDAKRAGLLGKDSWAKYPKAMYYWRAVSDMARSMFPECLGGASHTPEELGAEVDEDGDVIDVPKQDPPPPPPPRPRAQVERTPSVYDKDDPELQKLFSQALEHRQVPTHLWDAIGEKMHGKPSTELSRIVAEVQASIEEGKAIAVAKTLSQLKTEFIQKAGVLTKQGATPAQINIHVGLKDGSDLHKLDETQLIAAIDALGTFKLGDA